jgi:peptidoglycan hydrolase-like protein with peptidoglycan-binding domain
MATIQNGSQGADVLAWQAALVSAGYDPGTPDGVFGAKTDAATRSFQQNEGLTVDGIVGPASQTQMANVLQAVAYAQAVPQETVPVEPATNDDEIPPFHPGVVDEQPTHSGGTPAPAPGPSPAPAPASSSSSTGKKVLAIGGAVAAALVALVVATRARKKKNPRRRRA